jgi:hypothetical protein
MSWPLIIDPITLIVAENQNTTDLLDVRSMVPQAATVSSEILTSALTSAVIIAAE